MSSEEPKKRHRMAVEIRPRLGTILTAKSYSGHGRSRLYQLAATNHGLFRKNGRATVVDFDILDRILDALPHAKIKRRKSGVGAS
jgi:hypothetical protein